MPRATSSSIGRERFVKAANTRVNHALDEIRKVAKLSSDRYEYTAADVQRIIGALQTAVDQAREQLENRSRPAAAPLTIIPE